MLAVNSQGFCTKRLFSFIKPGTISTLGKRGGHAVLPGFDVHPPTHKLTLLIAALGEGVALTWNISPLPHRDLTS